MRSQAKYDIGLQNNVEEAGIVLMDASFHPLAIDRYATSVLTILAAEYDSGSNLPSETRVARGLEALMQSFQAHSPDNQTVYFTAEKVTYVGRIYHLETQNFALQSMFVLYTTKEVSAEDSLSLTAFEYRLTVRERETLLGMVMGLTNKELAQRMDIRASTAKSFVRMVMAKIGVTKRAAVVAKVFERKLNRAGPPSDPVER